MFQREVSLMLCLLIMPSKVSIIFHDACLFCLFFFPSKVAIVESKRCCQ